MAKSRGGRAPGFNSLMKKKWFTQSRLAAQRQVIVDIIKQEAKDARLAPLHDYEMQNDWMRWGWDWLMHKDLTWQKVLYQYSDKLLKWVLNAQLNTLPTPSNMRRWRIHGDFRCGLCKKANVGLTHILAGCPYVHGTEHKNPLLPEDRYTWRHNCPSGFVPRDSSEAEKGQFVAARQEKFCFFFAAVCLGRFCAQASQNQT